MCQSYEHLMSELSTIKCKIQVGQAEGSILRSRVVTLDEGNFMDR